MTYEKPHIVDLSGQSEKGFGYGQGTIVCSDGSGQTVQCGTGQTAEIACGEGNTFGGNFGKYED